MKFPRLRRDKMPSDAEVAAFDESNEHTRKLIDDMIQNGYIEEIDGTLRPTPKGDLHYHDVIEEMDKLIEGKEK